MSTKKSKKNLKFTTIAWLLAAMLFAVVVLVNVAASFFDTKIDMTSQKIYTMSKASDDFLKSLDKEVDVYFLSEIETVKKKYTNDVKELVAFLENYKKYDKINFHEVDIEKNPDIIRELNPEGYLGLKENDIVVKCGDIVKHVRAIDMYKERYDTVPDSNGNYARISKTFMGEGLITSAIKTAADGYTPVVYFLIGHGEKTLDGSFQMFYNTLKARTYEPKELDLSKVSAVPEDAAIIIVPGPKQDISKDELQKLNDYMDKGGNLSLIMPPVEDETDFDNLGKIMADYGLKMDYTRVYGTDTNYYYQDNKYYVIPHVVSPKYAGSSTGSSYDLSSLTASSSSLSNLDDLTSAIIDVYGDPYSYSNNGNSEAYLRFLDNMNKWYITDSRTIFQLPNSESKTNLKICPLMVTPSTSEVEACGGKKNKESSKMIESLNKNPELWMAAYSMDEQRMDSKLVVMPSVDFLTDDYAPGVCTYLYLSTISWMKETNIQMDIPAEEQTSDYMLLETKEDTNTVIAIIAAVPVVIAAVGVVIWLRRRNS